MSMNSGAPDAQQPNLSPEEQARQGKIMNAGLQAANTGGFSLFNMPAFIQSKGDEYTQKAEQTAASDQAAVNTQTQQNRPDITNAYGSTQHWEMGPDGRPVLTQSFGGPMGQVAGSLQQQAADALSRPFDLGSLGQMGTGEQARDQAINAAYGQATSRLDPMFSQRETQLRSRLANQGLDPSSEAYKNAMGDFERSRNDAYGSAMNSAIGQGTAAGSAIFGQNMVGRQQQLAEMLRQRGQAMGDLMGMQGLLGTPGFNAAGRARGVDYLGAQMAGDSYDMGLQDRYDDRMTDAMNAMFSLSKSFIPGPTK